MYKTQRRSDLPHRRTFRKVNQEDFDLISRHVNAADTDGTIMEPYQWKLWFFGSSPRVVLTMSLVDGNMAVFTATYIYDGGRACQVLTTITNKNYNNDMNFLLERHRDDNLKMLVEEFELLTINRLMVSSEGAEKEWKTKSECLKGRRGAKAHADITKGELFYYHQVDVVLTRHCVTIAKNLSEKDLERHCAARSKTQMALRNQHFIRIVPADMVDIRMLYECNKTRQGLLPDKHFVVASHPFSYHIENCEFFMIDVCPYAITTMFKTTEAVKYRPDEKAVKMIQSLSVAHCGKCAIGKRYTIDYYGRGHCEDDLELIQAHLLRHLQYLKENDMLEGRKMAIKMCLPSNANATGLAKYADEVLGFDTNQKQKCNQVYVEMAFNRDRVIQGPLN